MYFCINYGMHFNVYVPRYCIQLRVVDDLDSASFVLFDLEAAKFLNISALDLKNEYAATVMIFNLLIQFI